MSLDPSVFTAFSTERLQGLYVSALEELAGERPASLSPAGLGELCDVLEPLIASRLERV